MYISSVSSDNLRNENICGWIISLLLMQTWGEALHFSLADSTSYGVASQQLKIENSKEKAMLTVMTSLMSDFFIASHQASRSLAVHTIAP